MYSKHQETVNTAFKECAEQKEMVNHPEHYNIGDIECIDAMLSAFGYNETLSFCKLNAFKYIWRANLKGQRKDIEKATWYLQKFLEIETCENNNLKN